MLPRRNRNRNCAIDFSYFGVCKPSSEPGSLTLLLLQALLLLLQSLKTCHHAGSLLIRL